MSSSGTWIITRATHLTFLRLTPLLLSDKTQHVCPLGQLSSQTDGTRARRPARRPPQSWLRDTELPPSAASPCVKATPFCGLRVSKLSSTLSARITFPCPAMVQPPCPANDPALGQSQEPPGGGSVLVSSWLLFPVAGAPAPRPLGRGARPPQRCPPRSSPPGPLTQLSKRSRVSLPQSLPRRSASCPR